MNAVKTTVKSGFAAALVLLLGLVVGQITSPEPAQASGCNFAQCFTIPEDPGYACEADLSNTNCVSDGVSSCQTSVCPPQ